jgi:antitoxin component of RelBE/YafQ-DinJ toxin-antitoxin module
MHQEPRINVRIPLELKKEYIKYCEHIGTTYSDDLRRYITKCINDMKRAAKKEDTQ